MADSRRLMDFLCEYRDPPLFWVTLGNDRKSLRLSISPDLAGYCILGNADPDTRVWELRWGAFGSRHVVSKEPGQTQPAGVSLPDGALKFAVAGVGRPEVHCQESRSV